MFAHAQVARGRRHFEQVSASLCQCVCTWCTLSPLLCLYFTPMADTGGTQAKEGESSGTDAGGVSESMSVEDVSVFLHKQGSFVKFLKVISVDRVTVFVVLDVVV